MYHRCVKGADIIFKHVAAGGAAPTLRDEDVFVRDGDASEGAGCASGATGVGRTRLRERELGVDVHESVQRLLRLNLLQAVLREFGCTELALR